MSYHLKKYYMPLTLVLGAGVVGTGGDREQPVDFFPFLEKKLTSLLGCYEQVLLF